MGRGRAKFVIPHSHPVSYQDVVGVEKIGEVAKPGINWARIHRILTRK